MSVQFYTLFQRLHADHNGQCLLQVAPEQFKPLPLIKMSQQFVFRSLRQSHMVGQVVR